MQWICWKTSHVAHEELFQFCSAWILQDFVFFFISKTPMILFFFFFKMCFTSSGEPSSAQLHVSVSQFSEAKRVFQHYTIVHTVFKFGSNRTAFPSTDFALVSYIGFSKAAWPLLFSCTEHPVYCVFGAVLWK